MKRYLLCLVVLLTIAMLGLSMSMAMPQNSDDYTETLVKTAGISAESASRTSSFDMLSDKSIDNSPEYSELLANVAELDDVLNNQRIDIFEADGSTTEYTAANGDFKVDFDRMFRIYGANPDWMNAMKKSKEIRFADYILDSYIWEAPIYSRNGSLTSSAGFRKGLSFSEYLEIKPSLAISTEQEQDVEQFVKKNEGKWYWSRTGNMIPCDDLAFVTNTCDLSKYIDSFGFHVIEDIRYVSIDAYLADFVYIRADGIEYGIPFVQRSEYMQNGIENRTLIPLDKILNATLIAVGNNKAQAPIE